MISSLTDRYVRNKMSPSETESYEVRLLESAELQDELEAALLLKQAVRQPPGERREEPNRADEPRDIWRRRFRYAMAAAVSFLAVGLLVVFDLARDLEGMESRLDLANQPRSQLISASVQIMRSAGQGVPESIIVLPATPASLLLDIELGSPARNQDSLRFALEDEEGISRLSWTASPSASGTVSTRFNTELIPPGPAWINISDPQGNLLERRLVEFRRARQ